MNSHIETTIANVKKDTIIPFDNNNLHDLFTQHISGASLEERLIADFNSNSDENKNKKTKYQRNKKNKKYKTRKYKK